MHRLRILPVHAIGVAADLLNHIFNRDFAELVRRRHHRLFRRLFIGPSSLFSDICGSDSLPVNIASTFSSYCSEYSVCSALTKSAQRARAELQAFDFAQPHRQVLLHLFKRRDGP